MPSDAVVVTGASGLVGRHLLSELKDEYRVFAIARRSQRECGAPAHPNIAWMRVDIGDREGLERAFREIRTAGGARFLVHLAAYYDFTGQPHPEYRRTNVEGTRNVLDLAEALELERLVFASSVAACAFPRPEGAVTEATPADGDHVYARSKRDGERLVLERCGRIPAVVVRLGAVFSDWCEYPPLYTFLTDWTARHWRARLLAGRGRTAIPYVHLHDVTAFLRTLLRRHRELDSGEVLIASAEGCTSHGDLFGRATEHYFGARRRPVHVPAAVCGLALRLMSAWGRLTGNPPFERPWMRRYIDLRLEVDNAHTRERLGWAPSPRLRIERRIRFLIEALKSEPVEWTVRNTMAMRKATTHPDLVICRVLNREADAIVAELSAELASRSGLGASAGLGALGATEFGWFVRLLHRLVVNSVQTGNRMLLLGYFEVTARSRFEAGLTADDLTRVLSRLAAAMLSRLVEAEGLRGLHQPLYDHIVVPIEFGKDEIAEQYERFLNSPSGGEGAPPDGPAAAPGTARDRLEETIWALLARREG